MSEPRVPLHRRNPVATAAGDRRRASAWLIAALGAAPLAALSGCANMLGPRTIEITEEELQAHVSRRFPVRHRVLELLDVQLTSPRVRLLPASNRIGTEFDVRAGDRLLGGALTGALGLSYGVRFQPGDHTVRLSQVRLDRFEIDGAPPWLERQLRGIGQWLADQLLHDEVIHTLRGDDVRALQRQGYRPGVLKVGARAISLAIEPVR